MNAIAFVGDKGDFVAHTYFASMFVIISPDEGEDSRFTFKSFNVGEKRVVASNCIDGSVIIFVQSSNNEIINRECETFIRNLTFNKSADLCDFLESQELHFLGMGNFQFVFYNTVDSRSTVVTRLDQKNQSGIQVSMLDAGLYVIR
jgi:hypothetical protein